MFLQKAEMKHFITPKNEPLLLTPAFEQPNRLSYQQLLLPHYPHNSPWLPIPNEKIKRKQYGREWNLARRRVKHTPPHPWYGPYQTPGTHLTQSYSIIAHLPSWSSGIKTFWPFQKEKIQGRNSVFWIGKETHEHCTFTSRKSYPLVLHKYTAILALLTRIMSVLANNNIQLQFLGEIILMNIFARPTLSSSDSFRLRATCVQT